MEISINKKPFSISSNSRILYRMIQILLSMYYTGIRTEKSLPLIKIHLLIWLLQSKEREEIFFKSMESNYTLSIGIWSIDKDTNIALSYMFEDDLCNIKNKNYSLSEKGKKFISKIIEDKEVFISEKDFLSKVKNRLPETVVEKLQKLWI